MDIVDKWNEIVRAFNSGENLNIDLPISETITIIENLRKENKELKEEQEKRLINFLQINNIEY